MPDILLRQIPFLKPDEQTIRALVYSVRCVALGAPAGHATSKRLFNSCTALLHWYMKTRG